MMRKNKEQQAYHDLLRTEESLDPYQTLPVHELPEVKRQARAEYRKKNPLLKRLGRSALDNAAGVALILTNPQMLARSTEQNKESIQTGKSTAARRFAKAYQRREEDTKLRQETHAEAVSQARERHPNIAMREAELHAKWKKEDAERRRRRVFSKVVSSANHATEYFERRNAYSFAKAIPRRPSEDHEGFDGSYCELAKAALGDALAHKREDGTIPLLGIEVERERFAAHEATGASLRGIKQSEESYVGGASTALWQLGFVEFTNERSVAYGTGKFNPDIEWGSTPDGRTTTASLAFDSDNELHRMLVPEDSGFLNPRLEVSMSRGDDPRQRSYMDMRVVEAAVPVAVTA